MAAISYHCYQNEGLWILDARLELFLHFMLIVWEKDYADYIWLSEARQNYQLNSEGLFPDMMSLDLDNLLDNEEKIGVYQQLLADTQALIKTYAPSLSVELIENIRAEKPLLPRRFEPLPVEELMEVGTLLLDLIREKTEDE